MGLTRNLLLFAIIAITTSACGGGGGSSAISSGGATSTGGGDSATPITYGSVTLHWSAPTTWADGNAVSLSAISGYRLYYSSSATSIPHVIKISGGTTTQYKVTLPSGTYDFRIAAVDTNGYAGLLSPAISETL
ncbi:MAG: fibronectin type III domain-containing protein [Gammaproteobacteria bacterium]